MKEIVLEIVSQHAAEIILAIFTAAATWIGAQAKRLYTRYVTDETKKKVVETTVKYVEQLYSDLNGEEKLQKAIDAATEQLKTKGVDITDLELRVLIEAACNEFKKNNDTSDETNYRAEVSA